MPITTDAIKFSNIIKRKSLPDMITLFDKGFDIKSSSSTFWTDFPKFIKFFNKKAIKAYRLLSILNPLGFGNSNNSDITKNDDLLVFGTYNPSLFTLSKRTKPFKISQKYNPVCLCYKSFLN